MDRRTHPLVAGFDRAAATYERSRPEYPVEAIDLFDAELGLGPGRRVVDLAAGTGKLTRPLLARGATVVAVEPAPGMREELRRNVPSVTILDGTAESIPIPDGGADVVVCAQAFHWFDVERSSAEIARVVGPGGGLGILFNVRDESVPWVRELTRILDRYDSGAPRVRRNAWQRPLEATGRFEPLREREFHHTQRGSVERVVERALSVSYIAVLDEWTQRAVAAEVRTLLATNDDVRGRPEIEFPYETHAYWTRAVAGA